jgi:hypothetical protein
MQTKTRFLRLSKPVALGDHINGWRVCWIGGWDKCRVFFVVMVEREYERPVELPDSKGLAQNNIYYIEHVCAMLGA